MKKYQIAVIGGGAAGIMATLRVILNNDECLLFPGTPKDRKKSRAFWVSRVENMPGYEHYDKGIVDPNKKTLEWIEESDFSKNFHHIKNRGITEIKKNDDGSFHLIDSKGDEYLAEYVIMATGIMDVQPEINGSIKGVLPYANKQTIDYCLRCDGHHTFKKETAIIGHGMGAAWVAIMLVEKYACPSMSILTNGHEPEFMENNELAKLIDLYKINVITDEITEVMGLPREGKLEGFKLASGDVISSQMAFISLGSLVYHDLAKSLGANLDERGYVLTNEKGETNISGLYVAGDLRANSMKQIYTAWNHSVLSADDINGKIRLARRKKLLGES